MLTLRDLATVRGALLFWQEEICPHWEEAAGHYLRDPGVVPLTSGEVEQLRAAFDVSRVRYVLIDQEQQRLAGRELFASADEALLDAGPQHLVATVLVPPGI